MRILQPADRQNMRHRETETTSRELEDIRGVLAAIPVTVGVAGDDTEFTTESEIVSDVNVPYGLRLTSRYRRCNLGDDGRRRRYWSRTWTLSEGDECTSEHAAHPHTRRFSSSDIREA